MCWRGSPVLPFTNPLASTHFLNYADSFNCRVPGPGGLSIQRAADCLVVFSSGGQSLAGLPGALTEESPSGLRLPQICLDLRFSTASRSFLFSLLVCILINQLTVHSDPRIFMPKLLLSESSCLICFLPTHVALSQKSLSLLFWVFKIFAEHSGL